MNGSDFYHKRPTTTEKLSWKEFTDFPRKQNRTR